MNSTAKLYLERANNKIILAKMNFEVSAKPELKKTLGIPIEQTFYNDVISQSYYAIFYAAKAFLTDKGIETSPPEEHKKTYEEFKKMVESGELNHDLLEIYESEREKAEELLKIFYIEKKKRGRFTYNVNANANIPYAEESIKNAIKFTTAIKSIMQ